MARENRSDRGAMLALASVLVVFSLAVTAIPAGAHYYDTDGDGLSDSFEGSGDSDGEPDRGESVITTSLQRGYLRIGRRCPNRAPGRLRMCRGSRASYGK